MVSFNVAEVNGAPTAINDTLSTVAEPSVQRTLTSASVLPTYPTRRSSDLQTLTLTSVGSPVGGTVSFDATNVYFTPAADFNGAASFQHTFNHQARTNRVAHPKRNKQIVSFNVTEVNDSPPANNDLLSSVHE